MTYGPSEDHSPGVEIDLHYVALRDHLNAGHLPLGQHLMDEIVPGDVSTTGVDGVQQAHDEGYDEESPQALTVHLVLLLTTLLLLWGARERVSGTDWEREEREEGVEKSEWNRELEGEKERAEAVRDDEGDIDGERTLCVNVTMTCCKG